ncbi:YfgM family protein [Silvimonas soli]|uniref:YfgM family protein n=1 Tax=Silvimonas soli TaxID=2980100 RepID=UPI0024B36AD3|nr:tetratricopeptide repeat protein [Silvimonas soli]
MAFDLQEQEQIAELKAAWADWGKYLAGAVVVGLLAYGGWTGWSAYQSSVAEKAGAAYAQLETDLTGDTAKILADADVLKKDYATSPYAPRAALLAAKASARAGDLKSAQTQLEWAIAHASESEIRDAARLRLTAVQLDQKQFDAALKTLAARENDSYTPLFAEARGDVLAAKGDNSGARDAYKDALAKLGKDAPNVRFVEVKLEALGNS